MSAVSIEAGCPACGAPITFKLGSSIVVVCEYCNSVVARGDHRLEDLGKVARIAETGSPLAIGMRGVLRGNAFEITGRSQIAHQAGGMWDEWYAAFADGRWGWIAEAQGRFFVTFEQALPDPNRIPPFHALQLGQPLVVLPGSSSFTVAEKGVARYVAARGEIPYKLVPNQTYEYADLSGAQGATGTIDYSEGHPLVFVGREIALHELGIIGVGAGYSATPEPEVRRISAVQLSCPTCGGPLALRAPDQTERVTCPNCGSLLDVSEGKLKFLTALKPGKVKPFVPIGSVGEFSGKKYALIGFMQRSVTFDKKYYWEEYLLYHPEDRFRWLVRSDDHWNFVQTVPLGEVLDEGRTVQFGGKKFKLYQDALGVVEYVEGEFYWKVSVNETTHMADFICPPLMLSREISGGNPEQAAKVAQGQSINYGGEINWSLGAYLKREDVEKAFGITGLPRASKVAPNQPFLHKKVYKYWGLLLLVAFLVGVVMIAMSANRKVFEQTFPLQPVAGADKTQVIFTDSFDLKSGQNVRVSLGADVDNSWVYVEGDLINDETGLVQAFALPVEYYHGVDGGESWAEGSKSSDVHLSALPTGKYTMRLEAQWERFQQPISLSVRLEQGIANVGHLFVVFFLLSILPICVAIYHFTFETRRWQDSDYNPYQSSE